MDYKRNSGANQCSPRWRSAYERHRFADESVRRGTLAVSCASPLIIPCAPASGAVAVVSASLTDFSLAMRPVVIVWSVDGTPVRTNIIATIPLPITIHFTNLFSLGAHQVTVS